MYNYSPNSGKWQRGQSMTAGVQQYLGDESKPPVV